MKESGKRMVQKTLNMLILLEEDKPISGQKFVCVSFISPENILKQKNHFFFQEFLKHFDFTKSMEKFTQFLNFLSYKHNLSFDKQWMIFKKFYEKEKDKLCKKQQYQMITKIF